ncbi:complex i intermediate-associated protein 30 [Holotrichia oblita]|uniref:Complex i intermediate-associated protein 30 n=1 Tax=Holotrichia oblita TaxID=644536 RepID=A0ACB9TNS0_HOLOL|nr:complex i intermediate-associated protein 30 [Holotrichia oblita]
MTLFSRKLIQLLTSQTKRNNFHTTSILSLFWEKDEKSGYKDNRKEFSKRDLIREGLKELKTEIALWSQEVKERFEDDPVLIYRPGETDVQWTFNTEDSLKSWKVTSDKDNNEGYSTCSLTLNKYGNAVFSGELDTRVPKDGRTKRAGYCNMQTQQFRRSFKREAYLDWTCYNMLVLKVRGDGRSYMINIGTKGYYDILWNDMYHFVLYTRGGPYWQIAKIPFSKFFLSSKGRIQDRQFPLPLNRITSFGFSVGDKINGQFSLEMQYIGMEFDPNHTEEFAYEMYTTDRFIAGV